MRLFHLFLFLFISASSFGQLPSNVKKLEGSWRYKGGSGYEVWKSQDDHLTGFSFRVTRTGDTSRVEDMTISVFSKRLIYGLTTYNLVNDSLVTTHRNFIGGKRKMDFLHLAGSDPYSIEYKFGFFNRNKLKIVVIHLEKDRPEKYTLYRIKE